MNILHIGCGFSPWRGGGSIEYCEDLMNEQAINGYKISHFFSGRHFPFLKKNYIKKWTNNNIAVYELINSSTLMGFEWGTMLAKNDFDNKAIGGLFKKVLFETRPDLIHIHELLGISTEIIDIAYEQKIPMVMTLHDYQILCPTINLFDYNSRLCLDKNIGEKCLKCCMQRPLFNNNHLIKRTISEYYIKTYLPFIYNVLTGFYKKIKKNSNNLTANTPVNSILQNYISRNYDKTFQMRRDINLERLKKIKMLLAPSVRVKEIFSNYFDDISKITILPITVKHIENIKKKPPAELKNPIKFGVLNGAASEKKGANILLNMLKTASEKNKINEFKLLIYGNIDEKLKKEILDFSNVTYYGTYNLGELSNILDNIDIGIIPSICEETYGLTGQEFLAKGIPVIANKIGGITDYIIEGKTGWLNNKCSAAELFEKICFLISNPHEINKIQVNLNFNHKHISINQHFKQIQNAYHSVIN